MIKKFSLLLFITSLTAFLITRQFLPLPSPSTVERWLTKEKQNSNIFDSEKEIKMIIDNYIIQNKLKNDDIIDAFISIDAFSVKPSLIITNEGLVRGSINDQKIDLDDLELIKKKYIEFEKFAKNQTKYLINDVFVINLQPLNNSLPCQLIHKIAQTNGHANTYVIDILFKVAKEIKKNKINLLGICYDGDTGYNSLTDYWVTNVKKKFLLYPKVNFSKIKPKFLDDLNVTFSVDPLHLLKRYRYRLFTNRLHQFFSMDSDILNLRYNYEELNLPSVVYLNNKWTKMTDDLPLKLFTIHSLKVLIENYNFCAASYFIPPTLLNIALNNPTFSVSDRIYILKSLFTFLILYDETLEIIPNPLKEKSSKKTKDVRLFTKSLIRDTLSIISTILYIIEKDPDNINLNRIGSNPTEHLIGLFRMLSRDEHTYQKLKQVIEKEELAKELKSELGIGTSIRGRIKSYGTILNMKNQSKQQDKLIGKNPINLGISMFVTLGFPLYRKVLNRFIAYENYYYEEDKFSTFLNSLCKIESKGISDHSKKILSTRDLETGSIYNIKKRLEKSETFFNQKSY